MRHGLWCVGWIALVLATASCSLPRAVTGMTDGGPSSVDAWNGGLDAPSPIDAWAPGRDAWSPPPVDAWAPGVDAWSPPPVDAWMPPPVDAWTPPPVDAWMPPADDAGGGCNALYGSAGNYQLCLATATTCTFYATFGSGTACEDFCQARAGHYTCMAETVPSTADHCIPMGTQTCGHNMSPALCTCSYP